ncbi:MAG: hypothetical protein LBT59_15845 [Clostridiales bacterium]|jgi:hypothetical protein|nr:hypothetical protein [Clostridiales bacterium]
MSEKLFSLVGIFSKKACLHFEFTERLGSDRKIKKPWRQFVPIMFSNAHIIIATSGFMHILKKSLFISSHKFVKQALVHIEFYKYASKNRLRFELHQRILSLHEQPSANAK